MKGVLMSLDGKRAIDKLPVFGIACYEGGEIDGVFKGTHVGIVRTMEDAHSFLRGETPESLIRVYLP